MRLVMSRGGTAGDPPWVMAERVAAKPPSEAVRSAANEVEVEVVPEVEESEGEEAAAEEEEAAKEEGPRRTRHTGRRDRLDADVGNDVRRKARKRT